LGQKPFFVFCPKSQFCTYKNKKPIIPLDIFVMKTTFEEVLGDQSIFGSKICRSGLTWKIIIKFRRQCQNSFFRLNAHAEGKCDAGSSGEKHSKLSAESNGATFIKHE
jgi:hypothetical protein